MKRILYTISIILLLASAYFVYLWFVSEPQNREPLPSLLTLISTIILTIIAWKTDSSKKEVNKASEKEGLKVNEIEKNSIVDIDQKDENTNIEVIGVSGNSKVFINKGKESLNS